MNSFGGEQIPTSGLVDGIAAYNSQGRNTKGTYRIPLAEFKDLIKKGYIQFAGFGNKEFVLSPHIASKYLTEINGKAVESILSKENKLNLPKLDTDLKADENQLNDESVNIDTGIVESSEGEEEAAIHNFIGLSLENQ